MYRFVDVEWLYVGLLQEITHAHSPESGSALSSEFSSSSIKQHIHGSHKLSQTRTDQFPGSL